MRITSATPIFKNPINNMIDDEKRVLSMCFAFIMNSNKANKLSLTELIEQPQDDVISFIEKHVKDYVRHTLTISLMFAILGAAIALWMVGQQLIYRALPDVKYIIILGMASYGALAFAYVYRKRGLSFNQLANKILYYMNEIPQSLDNNALWEWIDKGRDRGNESLNKYRSGHKLDYYQLALVSFVLEFPTLSKVVSSYEIRP